LRADAGVFEDLAGLARFVQSQSEQKALGGDVAVAGFLGSLFGGVEYPRQRRVEINLPGAAA